jgi:hypothetical protein
MALTMTGQGPQAAGRAGAAQALRDAVIEIVAKREPKQQSTEDTTWTDPAARRSKREDVNA